MWVTLWALVAAASGFWLLASGFWLLASVSCLAGRQHIWACGAEDTATASTNASSRHQAEQEQEQAGLAASGFWLLASGFCLAGRQQLWACGAGDTATASTNASSKHQAEQEQAVAAQPGRLWLGLAASGFWLLASGFMASGFCLARRPAGRPPKFLGLRRN
jgi:hypothetical protein